MNRHDLENIIGYLDCTGRLTNNFGRYSKMYSMTTENIFEFLSYYDLKDKDVLTVASSGDQRLNAYLLGARNVTCFDINPITLLHMNLKDTIITNLSYDKFLAFFGINSKQYKKLDLNIFEEIKDLLEEDTYKFYSHVIYDNYLKYDNIYYEFIEDLKCLQRINGYLDKNNYYKLSNILKNKKIDFINCDLKNLKENIGCKKFDLIMLSNISDYIHQIYSNESLKLYYDLIKNLIDNLNENGIMQVGYIYDNFSTQHQYISNFSNDKKREKYFKNDMFSVNYVSAYDTQSNYDKVIVYKNDI